MKKLTVQNLNSLFDFLEQQPASVLWIRSKNYERQLYLSSNFDRIWGYPPEEIYEYPDKFSGILLPEDRTKVVEMLQSSEEVQRDAYLYRIQSAQGEIKYIKDWHYLLTDENGKNLGFAGFAQLIPQIMWEKENHKQSVNVASSSATLQKYIFDILKNELHIHSSLPTGSKSRLQNESAIPLLCGKNGEPVALTKRESECLSYLLEGKSAKQTAGILNISVRTAEFHLDNIRQKAKCRTKLEIFGRIATDV